MGEAVAVSSGEEEAAAKGTMRWERFMPRMTMRVLLVESDDSTRQVIAALLRKCGYRVAAVSDGLKAWEVLKGSPCNVDLVLTEVELPSVSGFALLTLATEHDVCKNIPVIMMSAHDSIGTVYKCMSRGAADYLVKPIRRNELQNLWQHVWRRRSLRVDVNCVLDDEDTAARKAEPAAEQNDASNRTIESMTSTQRDEEFVDKCDVQSSCTGSGLEPENAPEEQPLKWFFTPEDPASGLAVSSCKFGLSLSLSKEASHQRKQQVPVEGSGDNQLTAESYREAIDLIGTFDDRAEERYTDRSLHQSARNPNLSTKLNLSLKRSEPHDFHRSEAEESRPVKRSGASAFSRYTNNPWQQIAQKQYGSTERDSSRAINESSSEAPSPSLSNQKSILSLPTSWSKPVEPLTPHQRPYPASVPVKVLRSNSPSGEYPVPSPSADSQQDPSSSQMNSSNQFIQEINHLADHSSNHTNGQSVYNGQVPELSFDAFEDRRHFSLSGDRSATSSFANESSHRLNDMDGGNRSETAGNSNQNRDEGSNFTVDGVSQQSLQREAALLKFRLKRKLRCFDKKVRYESRKKLAEQRPRVKGQFVRQTTTDVCAETR